ncbi:MAG: LicD family protein, partial [Candidatus Thorarchaeota archaeon]
MNLKYYLSSGTLLGAVRHSGFIPWDDDIDVIMFRKDYEKFLESAPNEIGSQYFLQTHASEKQYPFPFAKLRNSETTLIEKEVNKFNINQGIYIDIFPIDGIPTNRLLRTLGWIPISIIGYLSLFKTVRKESPHKFAIIFRILNFIIPIKAWTLSSLYISLCKLCDVDKAKFVAFSAWPDYSFDLIIYRKSLFEETIMLHFHDHLFPVPSGYDELLKQLYGEYMVL